MAQIREKEKAARDLETQAAAIDAAVFDLKAVNPNAVTKVDERTPAADHRQHRAAGPDRGQGAGQAGNNVGDGGNLIMPTCWIIAGPNGAGKTTFGFMNDWESPVLVFEQRDSDRDIVHDDSYQLLLEEAKR